MYCLLFNRAGVASWLLKLLDMCHSVFTSTVIIGTMARTFMLLPAPLSVTRQLWGDGIVRKLITIISVITVRMVKFVVTIHRSVVLCLILTYHNICTV